MADRNLVMRILLAAQDRASDALNRIRQSGRGLAGELERSRRAVRDLERAQRDLARVGEVRNSLRSTSAALADVRNRQRELTEAIRRNGTATRAQRQELAALARRSSELQQTQARHRRELAALTERLRRAGVDSRNLAEAQAQLRRRQEQAAAAAARQAAALERQARAYKTLARARSMAGSLQAVSAKAAVGAAVTGAATMAPVRAYARAEDAGMSLRVAMMDSKGQVSQHYEGIDRLATRLGDRLPGTTADFKNLMTMLIRQGISAEAILNGTGEAAALLSVQLKKTPEAAAEMAAKLQDATRGTEKEMLGIMDGIQRLYYAGVTDSNALGAFSKLAPALDIVKVKGEAAMQMFGPLVGMLDQAGLVGESAGNALRKVFDRSMSAADINKKLGKLKKGGRLDASFTLDFTDGKGEFGGMDQMYAELAKLRTLSTQQRLEVIGNIYGDDAETLQALNVMIDKGKAGYEEFAAKMAAQASLNQRVNEQLGTLTNLWDAATGTGTNFLAAMGEAVAPEIKNLTRWIGETAEKMSLWAKANPETANTIMKVAAGVAAVLVVVSGLAAVAAAVLVPLAALKLSWVMLFTSLATGTGKVGMFVKALGVLKSAIMANPILALVVGIVAGIYLLWQNWDKVKAAIGSAWDWLNGVFSRNPILNYIFPFIGIARLIINNWDRIGPFFGALWDGLKNLFADNPALYALPFVGWGMWLINNWDKVSAFFADLWAQIKSAFAGGVGGVGKLILKWSPLGLFKQAFDAVLRWFDADLPGKFYSAGGRMVQGLIDGISNMLGPLKSMWNSAAAMFDGRMAAAGGGAQAASQGVRPYAGSGARPYRTRGFSVGGYTGAGGRNEAAGIVHKGEVVFSQDDVRRFGGWRVVDRLRRMGADVLQRGRNWLAGGSHQQARGRHVLNSFAGGGDGFGRQAGALLGRAVSAIKNPLAADGLMGRTLGALLPAGDDGQGLALALPGAISVPEAMRQAAARDGEAAKVSVGGSTYNIHVHVAGAADGRQIGQDVADALAQREAAQARRRRSMFADKD